MQPFLLIKNKILILQSVKLFHALYYCVIHCIQQHAGDLEEAASWMDEARSMDTADRFVNCKCVKYLLRVNKIDRAIETAGLFTRVRKSVDHICNFFSFSLSLSSFLFPLSPTFSSPPSLFLFYFSLSPSLFSFALSLSLGGSSSITDDG